MAITYIFQEKWELLWKYITLFFIFLYIFRYLVNEKYCQQKIKNNLQSRIYLLLKYKYIMFWTIQLIPTPDKLSLLLLTTLSFHKLLFSFTCPSMSYQFCALNLTHFLLSNGAEISCHLKSGDNAIYNTQYNNNSNMVVVPRWLITVFILPLIWISTIRP